MAVKISKALSPEAVVLYHTRTGDANYSSSYFTEDGKSVGIWHGKNCEHLGVRAGDKVTDEQLKNIAYGRDPISGYQLIQWRPPASEQTPKWITDADAWREKLQELYTDAITEGRVIFPERGEAEKLTRTPRETSSGAVQGPVTERESRLLEMQRIASEVFRENLASESGKEVRDYLRTKRGIKKSSVREFGLGVSDTSGRQLVERLVGFTDEEKIASGLIAKSQDGRLYDRFRGRLMFPIQNERGEVIAFGGRKAPNDNSHTPKYINSTETEIYKKSETLFNLHRASQHMSETGQVVIVEGYMDAIAAYQAGQRNVVALAGTALGEAATLKRLAHTAVLNLDDDTAGRRGTDKHITALLDAGMDVRAMRMDSDPAEWINDHGAKEYRDRVKTVGPLVSYLSDRAKEKFSTDDTYGRVDGTKWIIDVLSHVSAEHRESVHDSIEKHLKVLKIENEKEKEPIEHRAAWDMTISAPKTVSLTGLVGGDHRIIRAHDAAARKAADYVERAIQVKLGGNNAPQTTGRMVAAMFRHDTARPVEGYAAPQLHTHALIFNLSMDGKGQHRALNPTELFRLQSAAEAVYQNEMALALKSMGYELEFGKNLAIEIAGYTQEYRDVESPRAKEVEAEQARLGQYGPQAHEYIALSTREAKLNLPPEEVRALHLEHAAQYGNQHEKAVEAARERNPVSYSAEDRAWVADEAVRYAKQRLSERTSVMEWYEVHRDALRFGRGYIALGDVETALARAQERGEFHTVSHWREHAPGSRYTTPDLEQKEREILQWMAQSRGRGGAIAGEITRDEFRHKFRDRLNDGQKWLVWNLIHSEDRMVGVQGVAGSGKTTALREVKHFAEEYGYEVRAVAATSGAVGELRKNGIAAETLAMHMLAAEPAKKPTLYLLDEASLADVHQTHGFLGTLKPADRLIVIGDTRQHGSIGAGRVFAELQDAGMETYRLNKIVRQKTVGYRDLIKDLSRGQIEQALKKLDYAGRIHEVANERERYKAIAAEVLKSPDKTLVVSPDNRSRLMISDEIRAARYASGQLGQKIHRVRVLTPRADLAQTDLKHAFNYRVGDVVSFSRGSKAHGVRANDKASVVSADTGRGRVTVMNERNGQVFEVDPKHSAGLTVYEPTYREFSSGDRIQITRSFSRLNIASRTTGTLEEIDDKLNAKIRFDDGRQWAVNLEQMSHIDWAYAMTSYSAQGATTHRVIVHLDTDAPGNRMVNAQMIYTAGSRGEWDIQVYANSREDLDHALMRREEKATALPSHEVSRYRAEASISH